MMKRKRTILVSLDALGGSEYEDISRLPNFSRLLRKGACCPYERSVYPSLTFPSHASIATGCTPGHHGIVNNYILDPYGAMPKWNAFARALNRPAIWDYAARAGKKVMTMSWPVSAGANICWSMPEMSPAKPKIWNADSFFRQIGVLWKYGTPVYAVKSLLSSANLPKSWFLGAQPALDDSMIKTFLRAIEKYDFDLAMLHIYGMDDAKHTYGASSPEAHDYLRRYDDFAGRLMAFVDRKEQEGQEISLILTGDHSQKDIHSAIYGNHILEQMGLLEFRDQRVSSCKAYLDSCDGMAYLYIYETDTGKKQEILERLRARFRVHPGVRTIREPEEFIPMGCDSHADLVLEAAPGYGFEGGYCPDAVPPDSNGIAPSHYKAIHGYDPEDPGYYTMMMAYGPAVRHCTIEKMCVTDIAPTICNWMEIPTDPMDGCVVPEIFGG